MVQNNAFSLLHERLRKVIERFGYKEPTAVQREVIPIVLRGYSVLVSAPTGSGKTEAAFFPVMSKILEERLTGIRALYITPLRSLNRDIFHRLTQIGDSVGVSISLRHGDSSEREKQEFLRNPPAIAIMTPETFYLMLSVKRFQQSIKYLEYIIIDEVHELLSSKRGVELSLALERAETLYSVKKIKIIALSATLDRPYDVARYIMGYRAFKVVDLRSLMKNYSIRVKTPRTHGSDSTEMDDRIKFIADIIRSAHGKVLVFTNTRDTAEVLGALLRKELGDIVRVHHGSLSKDERIRGEKEFREGRVKALVATSSLELGIDIGEVNLVVQYMSPRQALKLAQRVGRASHKVGLVSRGIIVASNNVFDILESAIIAARTMRGNIENLYIHENALDALMHQLVGLVIEQGEIEITRAYNIITRSKFYENLDFDTFNQLVQIGEAIGILRVRSGKIRQGPRSKSYYYSTTMITESKQYNVIDISSSSKIGALDEEFVATLDKGDMFVLAGRLWEVVDISNDSVKVVPRRDSEKLFPPAWEGELIPVESGVAREVGSVLRRILTNNNALNSYPLDTESKKYIIEKIRNYLSRIGILPNDKDIVIEHYGDIVIIYSFLGSRANKALEYLLANYISQIEGYNPATASTPYIVVVKFSSIRPSIYVKTLLEGITRLNDEEVYRLVVDAVKKSKLFDWILFRVALRSGAVNRSIKDQSMLRRVLVRLRDTILGEEALREIFVRKIDFVKLQEFIDELRRGKKRLKIVELRNASPLAEDAINEARFSDKVVAQQLPSTLIAEAVKRRLSKKEVTLICLMCGNSYKARIENLPDKPSCPRCGSRLLYPAKNQEEEKEIRRLLVRRTNKNKLRREEVKKLQSIYEKADIVLNYGRKGIEALMWIGVGPATARKVLQKIVFGEEAFYRALIEAEINYHKYKHKIEKKK
jgi:ATP-dependent Lhr-like helicase